MEGLLGLELNSLHLYIQASVLLSQTSELKVQLASAAHGLLERVYHKVAIVVAII